MKRPRIVLLVITAITLIALVISWPTIPIKFNLGPLKVDTVLSHPEIDFSIFGLRIQRDLEPKLGLDLQGGIDLTLRADVSELSVDERDEALISAKEIIERRVNSLGVAEPIVQTSKIGDEYRIIVQLPGVEDLEEAKNLVGQTAKLEFREFEKEEDAISFTTTFQPAPNLENTIATGVDGTDLRKATVDFQQSGGQNQAESGPVVNFQLKGESADKFSELTRRLIEKPLIVFLDEEPISAPTVQSEISDSGIISGLSADEAKRLAIQLNAGALPVKSIEIIQERFIEATLGQQSVNQSLIAGAIGLLIVGAFMVAFYGFWGVLASVALTIYSLIVFAIFKSVPVTLTLSGIAGFILSVGMAVDANILIFERMKEELRAGKTKVQAVEIGFSRAWNSIRDSNVSSLITSAILFWFGTGSVKGFALALGIGILVSMFTAIVITRNFLRFIYRN
ncbi:protein translocase subunit SecD [Patescibacteria group bacterium]|nr:protein translocase subunit SecD [Patescibacteria group bacterium]